MERGPGKVQLLARLLPNIFQDGYKPAVIEPLVDKIRANLYGAEAADPLDFLQVRSDMENMVTGKLEGITACDDRVGGGC